MDPETRRVTARRRPIESPEDLPPGPRVELNDWPVRRTTVPAATWTKMLRGTFPPAMQDRLHRKWWDNCRPSKHHPVWPLLPHEEDPRDAAYEAAHARHGGIDGR
jgi:hypothetical protein